MTVTILVIWLVAYTTPPEMRFYPTPAICAQIAEGIEKRDDRYRAACFTGALQEVGR